MEKRKPSRRRSGSFLSARKKRVGSIAIITAFSLALGAIAMAQSGFKVLNPDLNDSGVWVTQGALVGRFNTNAQTLDGSLNAASNPESLDIHQDAQTILTKDDSAGELRQVATASLKLGEPSAFTSGAQIALGGGGSRLFSFGTEI